jgi:uncharacterized LabA/DUF88 family protein
MAKRRMSAGNGSAGDSREHRPEMPISHDRADAASRELAASPDGSASTASPTRDRVVIFIDGANLFYAAVNLQIEIDYTKLLEQLVGGRRLLRPYFYTGIDRHNDKQQGFLLWLRRNGYRVIAKDLLSLPDGSKKANLTVEIVVDMLSLAAHCDTLILLSGDGDLAYAVNAITYRGVKVEVVSLRSMTSEGLINVADDFTDLADLRDRICKKSNDGNRSGN